MSIFTRFMDHRDPRSFAAQYGQRRLNFFVNLLATVPRPIRILDVGGTVSFWRALDFGQDKVHITLLNVESEEVSEDYLTSIAGDARDLSAFSDQSIDIVYSNSVIEHVGGLAQQCQMANEIKRVGKRYFVQTPNRHFPIEPHFLVPTYQFMPLSLRTYLLTKSTLGWVPREPNWEKAKEIADSVRLLSIRQFAEMFPDASFFYERFGGLTKSVIAYHGW